MQLILIYFFFLTLVSILSTFVLGVFLIGKYLTDEEYFKAFIVCLILPVLINALAYFLIHSPMLDNLSRV